MKKVGQQVLWNKTKICFLPGSNRRPCPCEGHVITTTLRKRWFSLMNKACQQSASFHIYFLQWPHGATDNASDYGSEDCRFESCCGRPPFWIVLFFLQFPQYERAYKTKVENEKMKEKNQVRDKKASPPGGLEPPTFRLTAERASRLRHGGLVLVENQCAQLQMFLIDQKLVAQILSCTYSPTS